MTFVKTSSFVVEEFAFVDSAGAGASGEGLAACANDIEAPKRQPERPRPSNLENRPGWRGPTTPKIQQNKELRPIRPHLARSVPGLFVATYYFHRALNQITISTSKGYTSHSRKQGRLA